MGIDKGGFVMVNFICHMAGSNIVLDVSVRVFSG